VNTTYLNTLATVLRETNYPSLGPTDAGLCAVSLELVAALQDGRPDVWRALIFDLQGRLALVEGIKLAAQQMAGAAGSPQL
jgi:hypothetical protein